LFNVSNFAHFSRAFMESKQHALSAVLNCASWNCSACCHQV